VGDFLTPIQKPIPISTISKITIFLPLKYQFPLAASFFLGIYFTFCKASIILMLFFKYTISKGGRQDEKEPQAKKD
jgi:hypothetical protein